MTGEPQEQDSHLITLENDPIYFDGITPEELVTELNNSEQARAIPTFFNNLHLHVIDPAYLQLDEPQFQKDIQEIKIQAEQRYITDPRPVEDILLESARRMRKNSEQENLFLAHVYIKMREKGYPRYDEEKPCLVR